jgi:predicted Na+-dependent transporter
MDRKIFVMVIFNAKNWKSDTCKWLKKKLPLCLFKHLPFSLWVGGWVGLRVGLDTEANRRIPADTGIQNTVDVRVSGSDKKSIMIAISAN